MKARIEHFPEKNPNPILSVAADGTVIYSNKAGNLLLIEWGIAVGDKLPSHIEDLVQIVISRNSPEKTEVKVGNKLYLIVFSPVPKQDLVTISGFDISDRKEFEDELGKSKAREIPNLELAEIIDVQTIQSIMDDFYKLAHVPMSIDDLRGNILVGVGWQDICTRFHRIHPETCEHCIESDTKLSAGVVPGEFKLYKCKNNMWDIATPIVVGGYHVGNIFSGQFFFEDEPLDYELFHNMARKYGFNEDEYIAALKKVPRLSRKVVDTGLSFFIKLANLISQSSYSNIKLVHSLAERNTLLEALKKLSETLEEKVKERTSELENAYNSLKESEKHLAEAQRIAHIGNYDNNLVIDELYWSDELYRIIGLKPQEGMTYERFLSYVHPEDKDYVYSSVNDAYNGNTYAIIYRIVRPDGEERIIHSERKVDFDEENNPVRIKGTLQDITEHEKTDEKIKILANVVESTLDAIGTLSLDSTITSWNKGAEQIYGYLAEEILGKNISLPAPSHLKNETQEYIELIKQTGMSYRYTTSRMRKDGEIVILSITLSPVIDSHGKLTAISFISRDITEQKRSEEKLRESEEKYRNIVETANEGIALVNSEGMITYVNKKMADMLGYTEGEIIGACTWDFVEDKSTAVMLLENKRKGFADSIEIKQIRKDGLPLWVHLNSKPIFDNNGKFIGSLGMFTDMTERKKTEEKLRESEEKYRNIVEIANEGISILDSEGKFTFINRKHSEMLGYSEKELYGKYAGDFVEDVNIFKKEFKKRQSGVSESYELKLVRKDGLPIWVIINAKSLFDDNGKFIGSLSMLADITERKQAEEALKNFEVAKKKEIHHRIKNNLQVISSLLDLQADLFKGRENIIESEVLKAFKQSIDRVLSIALIHEELYKGKNIDLLNFSQYIRELAENLLLTNKLDIDVNYNFDLEENIFLDMDIAIPLGIIINELVTNSFKYAFSGRDKGEIRIKLHRENKIECMKEGCMSGLYVLSVSDNGKGIPEDLDIEDLDSLGLQLVTTLVEQLDGNLELKRDNGTEFLIKFSVPEN